MVGEWASGAALVSETGPEKHRGKALGLMQSCRAIGYGLFGFAFTITSIAFLAAAVCWAGIPETKGRVLQ
jgi:MFS family permease